MAVPLLMAAVAPPPTRGWTEVVAQSIGVDPGSPAHAGMDHQRTHRGGAPGRLPRPRGDGPQVGAYTKYAQTAPPPTRGWTRLMFTNTGDTVGSPAHAGMDP